MSRSGYTDDCEHLQLYRASVDRAISGRRGQAFLKELAAALDAMPEKRLIDGELVSDDGECCAIGAVCLARGIDVSGIDYRCPASVGNVVGIARAMAAEIEHMNDEGEWSTETDEQRWVRMRAWVESKIVRTP